MLRRAEGEVQSQVIIYSKRTILRITHTVAYTSFQNDTAQNDAALNIQWCLQCCEILFM